MAAKDEDGPDDERQQRHGSGRNGRAWILKQEHALVVSIASFLVFGTGGALSHGSLGGKLDAHGEKLDGIKLSVTKLEVKIDASEALVARVDAATAALAARVGLLEQNQATLAAQIQALKERK